MKITLITLGNKAPDWVLEASQVYLQRINHGKYTCKVIEIPITKINKKSAQENMQLEAKKIENHLKPDSFVIVLDERGNNFTSLQFANKLSQVSLNYSDIIFIIGGADGIDPSIKSRSNLQLSFSKLTFPHMLVRVIFLEQLYRAISILENHPYHRE